VLRWRSSGSGQKKLEIENVMIELNQTFLDEEIKAHIAYWYNFENSGQLRATFGL